MLIIYIRDNHLFDIFYKYLVLIFLYYVIFLLYGYLFFQPFLMSSWLLIFYQTHILFYVENKEQSTIDDDYHYENLILSYYFIIYKYIIYKYVYMYFIIIIAIIAISICKI